MNFSLYGLLSKAGLSGNAYDLLIDWLKDKENLASLTDAVNTKKLYKADAVRRALSRCLVLNGCEAYQHGKSVIAGVRDVTFTLNTGRDDADTYSACLLDVSYQLEHHLLHPPANSPPLIDPRTSHVFSGAESNVDNFANSPGRRRRAVKARRKRGRGAVTPAGHGGGPGRVRKAPNGGVLREQRGLRATGPHAHGRGRQRGGAGAAAQKSLPGSPFSAKT